MASNFQRDMAHFRLAIKHIGADGMAIYGPIWDMSRERGKESGEKEDVFLLIKIVKNQ